MAQFKTFDARVLRSVPLSEFTTRLHATEWNRARQNTSPEGAAELSPALQRGVE